MVSSVTREGGFFPQICTLKGLNESRRNTKVNTTQGEVECTNIYACTWFTTSFCIDRLVSPVGPMGGWRGNQPEGKVWPRAGILVCIFATAQPAVAVIHHTSATSRRRASATVHPHDASICVVLIRAAVYMDITYVCAEGEGLHCTYSRFHVESLFLSPSSLSRVIPSHRFNILSSPAVLKISTKGIHDPMIVQANLHLWNPQRGQRQPPATACGNLHLPLLRFSPQVHSIGAFATTDTNSTWPICTLTDYYHVLRCAIRFRRCIIIEKVITLLRVPVGNVTSCWPTWLVSK